jgi:hypothetical protein
MLWTRYREVGWKTSGLGGDYSVHIFGTTHYQVGLPFMREEEGSGGCRSQVIWHHQHNSRKAVRQDVESVGMPILYGNFISDFMRVLGRLM